MGIYVNPGNSGFARIAGPNYIDKSGLISLMNRRIGTEDCLVCISRPRRFGKSYAAKMLSAYYDCSCDSHEYFDHRKIAADPSYAQHLNQYFVISLDITAFISEVKAENGSLRTVPAMIQKAIRKDLLSLGFTQEAGDTLNDYLIRCAESPGGKPFVFIIDEWDAMIREGKHDLEAQEAYLNLLRGWFKNSNFTPRAVAGAYMTGILPIKKDGSQSAISDFHEYSVIEPMEFAEYFGFSEQEVKTICTSHQLSFEALKKWYDGYNIGTESSIYNPYSVMSAVQTHKMKSYWKRTTAAEALLTYIDLNQHGLQTDVARLIAGESIEVDTDSFQNDVESFHCKDDVLTLLIHLGYLTYMEGSEAFTKPGEYLHGFARIPNEEVRLEFHKILRRTKRRELIQLVQKSDQLLQDTLDGKEAEVAKAIQDIHDTGYAPTLYNHEQALRYTIKMAYISCVDLYARMEELPSGHGIADVVFLPKRNSFYPPIVMELKWNKCAHSALSQIKDRNYQNLPSDLSGETILVGISYDEKTKLHSCRIEKIHIRELFPRIFKIVRWNL